MLKVKGFLRKIAFHTRCQLKFAWNESAYLTTLFCCLPAWTHMHTNTTTAEPVASLLFLQQETEGTPVGAASSPQPSLTFHSSPCSDNNHQQCLRWRCLVMTAEPGSDSTHSPHMAGMQIEPVVRHHTPWTRDSPELIKQSLHIRTPGSSPGGRDASQGYSSRSRDSLLVTDMDE